MRRDVKLRLGFALAVGFVCSVIAGGVAKDWFQQEASRLRAMHVPTVQVTKTVVAREDLRFGMKLSPKMLRIVEWPSSSIPKGTFRSIAQIFKGVEDRLVLAPMRANEPLLVEKLTGPGQRASLSSILSPGMKAVSLRVNEVVGVSGFVLPGDFVDILMTRTKDASATGDQTASNSISYTEPVLQKVRVLAVDQSPDIQSDLPKLARTVTVEVGMVDAQKLTLAGTVGNLTLVLRRAMIGEKLGNPKRITVSDLGGDNGDNNGYSALVPEDTVVSADTNQVPENSKPSAGLTKITVVRSAASEEYKVKRSQTTW